MGGRIDAQTGTELSSVRSITSSFNSSLDPEAVEKMKQFSNLTKAQDTRHIFININKSVRQLPSDKGIYDSGLRESEVPIPEPPLLVSEKLVGPDARPASNYSNSFDIKPKMLTNSINSSQLSKISSNDPSELQNPDPPPNTREDRIFMSGNETSYVDLARPNLKPLSQGPGSKSLPFFVKKGA